MTPQLRDRITHTVHAGGAIHWPVRAGWHYAQCGNECFLVRFYKSKGCFKPLGTPLKAQKHWAGWTFTRLEEVLPLPLLQALGRLRAVVRVIETGAPIGDAVATAITAVLRPT